MGMFDYVTILHKLPWPEVQDATWQTKCTPAQYLNHYEIRADGTLWHEAYDWRLVEDEDAAMGFACHQNNKRWEQVYYSGELECHEYVEHTGTPGHTLYSIQFWFRDGVVKDVIYEKTEQGNQKGENHESEESKEAAS